jgi:hypothetical protein
VKTDTVLVIDAHTVLPLAIPLQGLKPVAWRNLEFMECNGGVKLIEFAGGSLPQRLWTCSSGSLCSPAVEDILCAPVLERLDHVDTIAWNSCYHKHNTPIINTVLDTERPDSSTGYMRFHYKQRHAEKVLQHMRIWCRLWLGGRDGAGNRVLFLIESVLTRNAGI